MMHDLGDALPFEWRTAFQEARHDHGQLTWAAGGCA